MTSLPRDGSVVPMLLGGGLCACAYLALVLDSQGYGTAQLSVFLLTCASAGLISLGLWLRLAQQGLQPSWPWVLGLGLLLRILGLFSYPVFEDDFFRYLWDGRMLLEAGTPYGVAPAEFFDLDHLKAWEAEVLDGINYPNVPTIYGPVAQWFFGLCYLLAPGSVQGLQLGLAVADLGVLLLLLRLAAPRAALLYALSPLVIKEFAMSAHVDVLGVLFLVAALLAYRRQAWWLLGVLLALAAGVKVFALVVAPFLLGMQWRAWLAMLVAGVLVAWPFGLQAAWLPEGLAVMGSGWLFNSPLHLALRQVPQLDPAWIVPGLLLLFALVWCWRYGEWMQRWLAGAPPDLQTLPHHWLFGLFLLILPAINPWYLVWWLPFAVLRPLWTPWVASLAVLLSYASGINLEDPSGRYALYQVPTWILGLEFGLIALAVLLDLRQWRQRAKRPLASTESAC